MRIHHEGYRLIAAFAALTIGMAAVVHFWMPLPEFIKILLYIGFLAFLIWIIRFFRFKVREIIVNENTVIAPADGKVVVIEEIENAEYFGDKRIQVSIFMSPNNIHVNWIPLDGKVSYRKYFPGKYLVAWHPKSSMENERTSIVLEGKDGKSILVRQIAGALARRIVCYPEEGQILSQGDELGFIKFGSRVDVLLPMDALVHVKLDQKVKGRETAIASFQTR